MALSGKPILQVGSNIFELIEFTLTQNGVLSCSSSRTTPILYGVNVAKVREVIRLPNIVPCLSNTPEVLGVFNLRGMPIPAIHLAKTLGYSDEPVTANSQVIVTEFSRRLAGFVVSGTKRIRRVSWDKILPPTSDAFNMITGMMLIENQDFIFILDFERILLDIENKSNGKILSPSSSHDVQTSTKETKEQKIPVIVIDDSQTARRALCDMLKSFNFEILEYSNAETAWKELSTAEPTSHLCNMKLIISDVEMPKLDGYSFVKRVRNNDLFKHIPIILHTSLSGDVNRERAKQAGADAYVGKLNKQEMLDALKLIFPDRSFHGGL